jgi:hypothetical protein
MGGDETLYGKERIKDSFGFNFTSSDDDDIYINYECNNQQPKNPFSFANK